jgi:glucose/arabinose dehydrogenase
MMHAVKIAQSVKLPRLALLLVAMAGLGLAGCDDNGGDPRKQIGANPPLPALQQYLIPPIQIARVAAWGKDTPTASEGLQVHALATGFEHPRSLYVLPNGDVLVVESNGPKAPIYRPKDIVTSWVTWLAGAKAEGGNRITLLRGANADGSPQLRTVFLDHLNSPFGVALVGNDLYVANTDAIIRYPYQEGQTSITAPGAKLTDLPGGPIDHHWTKALLASPDGSKLYVGVGSNSNITENGIGAEYERAAIWEVDRASGAHRIFASGLRNPTGLAWEPETSKLWAVVNERDEIGPDLVPDYLTSVQDGAFYGWPYSYFGQHLDPRVQPQRPDLVATAIEPDYALSSHVAPLGVAMYAGAGLPSKLPRRCVRKRTRKLGSNSA